MKWQNKKWVPQIGDLLTHPIHGIGYVTDVNHQSKQCVVRWNKWGNADAYHDGNHYCEQIDWENAGMRVYLVKR